MSQPESMPLTQRIVAPYGTTFRDGGVLDFGREHIYLNEQTNCEIMLPAQLVEFIEQQAIQRSEQHVGAAGINTHHGQAQEAEAAGATADGAGVARSGRGWAPGQH